MSPPAEEHEHLCQQLRAARAQIHDIAELCYKAGYRQAPGSGFESIVDIVRWVIEHPGVRREP